MVKMILLFFQSKECSKQGMSEMPMPVTRNVGKNKSIVAKTREEFVQVVRLEDEIVRSSQPAFNIFNLGLERRRR